MATFKIPILAFKTPDYNNNDSPLDGGEVVDITLFGLQNEEIYPLYAK